MFSSCAKVEYLWHQSIGQWRLHHESIPNKKILKNEKYSQEIKEQISKIQKYKKFFYDYLNEDFNKDIYSETTILNRDAVSYLVIVSPFDQIKALQECFPFAGCFPYLGFFNKDHASEYQKRKEQDGFITWQREVYAYSTLGYFDDPILSSFFNYRDFSLAEMIFHELIHTVFFVEDEVAFNESLATYFGEELALLYFDYDEKKLQNYRTKQSKDKKLKQVLVKEIKSLKELYRNKNPKNNESAQKLLKEYLNESLYPNISKTCNKLSIERDECYPLSKDWNNAMLAAYMTYEENVSWIHKLRLKHGFNIAKFFNFIKEKYKVYEDCCSDDQSYEAYLKKLI